MVEKLLKPWNALKAGAGVTTDPAEAEAEGAFLIGDQRLAHLRAEGFLPAPEDERRIPVEAPIDIVRRAIHAAPVEFPRGAFTPELLKANEDLKKGGA